MKWIKKIKWEKWSNVCTKVMEIDLQKFFLKCSCYFCCNFCKASLWLYRSDDGRWCYK